MNLFDYQKESVAFLGAAKRGYLALDMGMGKTLTALSAAHDFGKKNVLLIAEKNEIVNSENFRREVETYFQGEFQYHNLREKEIPPLAQYNPRYVCGINPDALVKLDPEMVKACFDTAIMDEATMAKTTTTARFKRVHKIVRDMEYVALLSGTPMMNGASELYAPLLLLDHPLAGGGLVKDRQAFEAIFAGGHMRKIRNTGIRWQDYIWWANGANHVRELRYLTRDKFFFKQKGDTGLFKKKTRMIERVHMTVPWLHEYQSAWTEYFENTKVRHGSLSPKEYLEKVGNISEMKKIIENGKMYQVNSKWKARQVIDDVESGKYGKQRIVIFTMYTETYAQICNELGDRGISWGEFEELQYWKDSGAQVLVGRIKAHGKGGNVPEASACLFVDMDFVPSNNLQAENRIDRPEQKNDMLIVYYMTNGDDIVDEHVRKINQRKIRTIEEFMRPLTDEELAAMPAAIEALKMKYRDEFRMLGYA